MWEMAVKVFEFLRKMNGEKVLFVSILGFFYLGYQMSEVKTYLAANEEAHSKLIAKIDTVARGLDFHVGYEEGSQNIKLDTIKAREDRILKELAKMGKVLY